MDEASSLDLNLSPTTPSSSSQCNCDSTTRSSSCCCQMPPPPPPPKSRPRPRLRPRSHSSVAASSCSNEPSSSRPYECRFCPMKFAKSQALGGHMNRHRQEREREQLLHARRLVMEQDWPTGALMLSDPKAVISSLVQAHQQENFFNNVHDSNASLASSSRDSTRPQSSHVAAEVELRLGTGNRQEK